MNIRIKRGNTLVKEIKDNHLVERQSKIVDAILNVRVSRPTTIQELSGLNSDTLKNAKDITNQMNDNAVKHYSKSESEKSIDNNSEEHKDLKHSEVTETYSNFIKNPKKNDMLEAFGLSEEDFNEPVDEEESSVEEHNKNINNEHDDISAEPEDLAKKYAEYIEEYDDGENFQKIKKAKRNIDNY